MNRTRTVTTLSVAGVVAAAGAAACINLAVIAASSDGVGASSQSLRDVGALGAPEITVPRTTPAPTPAVQSQSVVDVVAEVLAAPAPTLRVLPVDPQPVRELRAPAPQATASTESYGQLGGGVREATPSAAAEPEPSVTSSPSQPDPTPSASESASSSQSPSPSDDGAPSETPSS